MLGPLLRGEDTPVMERPGVDMRGTTRASQYVHVLSGKHVILSVGHVAAVLGYALLGQKSQKRNIETFGDSIVAFVFNIWFTKRSKRSTALGCIRPSLLPKMTIRRLLMFCIYIP